MCAQKRTGIYDLKNVITPPWLPLGYSGTVCVTSSASWICFSAIDCLRWMFSCCGMNDRATANLSCPKKVLCFLCVVWCGLLLSLELILHASCTLRITDVLSDKLCLLLTTLNYNLYHLNFFVCYALWAIEIFWLQRHAYAVRNALCSKNRFPDSSYIP